MLQSSVSNDIIVAAVNKLDFACSKIFAIYGFYYFAVNIIDSADHKIVFAEHITSFAVNRIVFADYAGLVLDAAE